MNFIKPIAIAFLFPGLFTFHHASSAVTPEESSVFFRIDTLSWDAPLPFDQEVKTGKLENGFQYFIRKNVEPKDRVTMYLATKVGSILETEEEQGLAHIMEHMNFNGLKHFPKNELVDYLFILVSSSRAGAASGAGIQKGAVLTSVAEHLVQQPFQGFHRRALARRQGFLLIPLHPSDV